MKLLLTMFVLPLLNLNFSPGFYDQSITLLDGSKISMTQYKGNRIVIYEFDGKHADFSQFLFLDSLQKTDSSFKIIAVPVNDFSGDIKKSEIKMISDSLKLSFPLTDACSASKRKGKDQHSLFHWLTSVTDNTHFDAEIEQAGNIFLINERGEMYGILTNGTSRDLMGRLIKQKN